MSALAAKAARKLEALLDAEAQAILAADYDSLKAISDKKEGLLMQLEEADVDTMRRLKTRLEHNLSLLGAAIEGFRGAVTQISAAKEAAQSLKTYGPQGHGHVIERKEARLDRKA